MRLGIAEILKKVSGLNTDDERIAELRKNHSIPLCDVLKGIFNPYVVWMLPDTVPPYKPNELVDQQAALYTQTRKFYLFTEDGNPNLKQLRREALFIELLETVDAEDAKLLIAMKDKTIPYPNITAELINKAFPGLLPA